MNRAERHYYQQLTDSYAKRLFRKGLQEKRIAERCHVEDQLHRPDIEERYEDLPLQYHNHHVRFDVFWGHLAWASASLTLAYSKHYLGVLKPSALFKVWHGADARMQPLCQRCSSAVVEDDLGSYCLNCERDCTDEDDWDDDPDDPYHYYGGDEEEQSESDRIEEQMLKRELFGEEEDE